MMRQTTTIATLSDINSASTNQSERERQEDKKPPYLADCGSFGKQDRINHKARSISVKGDRGSR
jgi:hypothetical protein